MDKLHTVQQVRAHIEERIAAAMSLSVATDTFEGRIRKAWSASTVAVLEELLSLLPENSSQEKEGGRQ